MAALYPISTPFTFPDFDPATNTDVEDRGSVWLDKKRGNSLTKPIAYYVKDQCGFHTLLHLSGGASVSQCDECEMMPAGYAAFKMAIPYSTGHRTLAADSAGALMNVVTAYVNGYHSYLSDAINDALLNAPAS